MSTARDAGEGGRASGRVWEYANRQATRIARVFIWATAEELIESAVNQALSTVDALTAGKTEARESKAVTPANADNVASALRLLPPTHTCLSPGERLDERAALNRHRRPPPAGPARRYSRFASRIPV